MVASEMRRERVQELRSFSQWTRHLDEAFVKAGGLCHWLWRAVDHEGEVLWAVFTKRENKAEVLKFLQKLMMRHEKPEEAMMERLA